MDTYNRKYIVIGAMFTMALAFFGYGISNSIPSLMVFRLVQGCGMAFGNACCLAMVADTIPKEKYAAGIGYFSLAQVISQAMGPSVGLWLVGLVDYRMTFIIVSCIMLIGVFLTFRIRLKFKRTKKLKVSLDTVIAKEAILPGILQAIQIMGFVAVGSFLFVFAGKQGVTGNIGLFFTVSAVIALITRPVIGRMTDKYGLVKLFIPGLLCNIAALFIISVSHTLVMFLAASVVYAIGSGVCMPSLQTLTMKAVPNERRGSGSTTNYLGMDVGALTGSAVAGAIAISFLPGTRTRAARTPAAALDAV
jgi:MFS family permease